MLCIGLGNPVPTVSLYLDGHLVRSDNIRHLVTTIFNSSRVLNNVGCSATNGKVSNFGCKSYLMSYENAVIILLYPNNIHTIEL